MNLLRVRSKEQTLLTLERYYVKLPVTKPTMANTLGIISALGFINVLYMQHHVAGVHTTATA